MIDATLRWIIINLAITPADRLKKYISGEASPRGFQIKSSTIKKYHSVEAIPILMTTPPQCPVLASLNRHQHLVTAVLLCITEVTKPVAYRCYKVLGLDSLCDFFYPFFFKHFSAAHAPWDQAKYNASFTLFPVVPSFADIFCQPVQYFIMPFLKLTFNLLEKIQAYTNINYEVSLGLNMQHNFSTFS